MTERVAVKLLQYYGGVNKGEIAGYVPEVAERLIDQGYAELYVPDAETAVDAAAPAPAAKDGKGKLPAQGADA